MRHRHDGAGEFRSFWSPHTTRERLGGDETLVRELVDIFLGSCPAYMDNLRARLRDDDLPGLARAAHALKGSIANFTHDGPAQTAREVERLAGLGQREAAAGAVHRLEGEVARLLDEMKAFRGGTRADPDC